MMRILYKIALATTFMSLLVHTTYAACGITSGSIRILANDFPAIHAVI
ncbi:TPA: sugar ABC transporter substrate-binding protein, partial [Candidatus Poribacteria bacterium]|nr:sugar ABC transporter substrate-binding protein [Candidatus Poribacteria bacterium]